MRRSSWRFACNQPARGCAHTLAHPPLPPATCFSGQGPAPSGHLASRGCAGARGPGCLLSGGARQQRPSSRQHARGHRLPLSQHGLPGSSCWASGGWVGWDNTGHCLHEGTGPNHHHIITFAWLSMAGGPATRAWVQLWGLASALGLLACPVQCISHILVAARHACTC